MSTKQLPAPVQCNLISAACCERVGRGQGAAVARFGIRNYGLTYLTCMEIFTQVLYNLSNSLLEVS